MRVCSPEENDQDEERIEKPKDIGEAGEVSREGTTEDRVAGGPYGPWPSTLSSGFVRNRSKFNNDSVHPRQMYGFRSRSSPQGAACCFQ